MPPAKRLRHSPLRTILFWVVLLLVPLFLVGLIEIGLRVAGVGVPPPLFREVRVGTVSGYMTNPEVGRRYFPAAMEAQMPRLGFQFFTRDKNPAGLRIFSLGGSSTAGFPYHAHGSFTGLLGTQLRQLLPGRTIETVNCAMTAIGSQTVRDFVPEILDYEPDLLLIYMGHNEFYGAGGVGSITAGSIRWARPLVRGLLGLRLAAVLRGLLPGGGRSVEAGAGRNVMETMVAERTIGAASPLRQIALREFRDNLAEVLCQAQGAGVPVLLCTVASNLRAQPPFGSAHPAGFSRAAEFEVQWQAARRAWERGDTLRAREALDATVALDSTYADARYLRGVIRDRSGNAPAARADYEAAREYDTVPFRAPAAINTAIRQAAREHNVALVEVAPLCAAHSPDGIPGAELFLEHLHPNLQGHALIAEAIARELCVGGWGVEREGWRWQRNLAPQQYVELSGITELDREIGELRVHMLTQKWPYRRDGGMGTPFVSQREERLAELAEAFVRKRIPLNEAHQALGDHYLEKGRIEDALREYRSAFTMFPLSPWPALRLGQLLLRTGRPRPARHYLDLALALAPESEAGMLLMMQALAAEGNLGAALAVGSRALELHPQSPAIPALIDTLRARAGP